MNYVLAAIASLGNRAKVVGVNKCCGAGNGQVMGMFYGKPELSYWGL